MESFKLVAWNIEWCDRLLSALAGEGAARAAAETRADAIASQIRLMDPDILLVTEGPRGEARAQEFFARVTPGYRLVTRGDDRLYLLQGQQWIWFLVREGLPMECRLLHTDRFEGLTAAGSGGFYGRTWPVAMPRFVRSVDPDGAATLGYEPDRPHRHYRTPQVLLVDLEGFRFEVIGCHLKSKHIGMFTPSGILAPDGFRKNPEFVARVVEARAKLSSEAANVRAYIEARFLEDDAFPVILAGDLNDGPGKERVERQFMLHDLVSNIQGDVFFASRFLNHALFDMPDEQRWTARFRDRLDPGRRPEILIDHILFTQAWTGSDRHGCAPFRALRQGGTVEHGAHHLANAALPAALTTSDHRPVSMRFARRAADPASGG
ncbi:MAG: hypothetical protein SNJ79_14415 [Sphingomonadaceae bacterium]